LDEKALAKALKEKVIAGAALDVFEKEPSRPIRRCSIPRSGPLPRLPSFCSGAKITRLMSILTKAWPVAPRRR